MILINLLPEAERATPGKGGAGRWSGRWRWPDAALCVLGLGTLAGAGVLWSAQRGRAAALEARVAQVAADSARLAEVRALRDSLESRARAVRERAALIERLDEGRFASPRLMDEISRSLPALAWLVSLRRIAAADGFGVELRGVAADPLAVTEFARGLQASERVGAVRILSSQQRRVEGGGPPRQDFSIVVELR